MEIRMGARKFSVFFGLCLVFLSGSVLASGFVFNGIGTRARGMGGAFRALADDWSAVYYNPAGLNLLDANNVIAADLTIMTNRYLTSPNVLWGGDYESGFLNGQRIANKHEILNTPQGAIISRLPVFGETVFGFSILQTFDQNQSWQLYQNIPAHNDVLTFPDNQFGINLDVVNFELSAARGFMEDRLSLGLGLALVRADLDYSSIILRDNPMPSPISDRPHERIPEWYDTNVNGYGFGYRLGALYEVTDRIHAAVTYTGKSSVDLSGDARMEFHMGKSPYINEYITSQQVEAVLFLDGEKIEYTADAASKLDLPASVAGGIAVDVLDNLTLTLDAEMIFWSQFKGLNFDFSGYEGTNFRNETILTDTLYQNAQSLIQTDVAVPIAWKNAPRIMTGAEYKPFDFFRIRGGFGADKSAVEWENPGGITQIPQFIDLGTKYTYSFGFGVDINQWKLEFATSYTSHPDITIHSALDSNNDGARDNLVGDFEADYYQTVLGITYRF